MKIKKLLAITLALLLCVTLFACNKSDEQTSDVPATPAASDSPAAPAASETPAAPAPSDTPAAPAASDTPAAPAASDEPSAPPEEEPIPDGPPLKIGHICDLTGPEAMTGAQARDALQYAVDSLGGKFYGRPVEIIVGDAQGQPSVAVDLAVKMVEQDGVVAIFGPTQIGQKSAVSEYMKEAGIPLIFYNPTPTGLFMSNEWLVGSGGTTPQMPSVMAVYAYEELGYRTVHTIAMDNAGGKSFIDPFVETFEKLGGTVLQQQWAPVPTPDFSPYLATLGDADALVAWTSGSDAIALWQNWSDLGLNDKLPIITPMHGGFTDSFVAGALSHANPAACEAMMGALAPMMYTYGIDSPANQEFVAGWTEEFGERPGGTNLPGSNAQAIYLLNAAITETKGDTTPEVLIDALFSISLDGPEGHLSFVNSRAATKDVYIVKVVQLDDESFNYEVVKAYHDVPPTGLGS